MKIPKSKCVHCVDGVVLSPDCKRVIGRHFCDIDADDLSVGCSPDGCHYYRKKTEVKNDTAK